MWTVKTNRKRLGFNLQAIWRNSPLKRKLMSILLLGLILLAVVSVDGLYRIQRQYDQILSETYEMLLTSVINNFSEVLDKTSNYMMSISTDDTLQSALSGIKDTDDRTSLGLMNPSRSVLQGYLNNTMNPALFALGVCTEKGVFYNSTYYSDNGFDPELGNKFTDEEFRTLADSVPEYQQLWITDYTQYGLVVAQRIRRIHPLKLDDLGVIIGCIDLENLINESVTGSSHNGFVFSLYDKEGNLFYQNLKEDITLQFDQVYPPNASYAILENESGSWFAISGSIKQYGWCFSYAVPYDSIQKTLRSQRIHVMIMLSICVIASFSLGAVLLRQILADLDKLMDMTEKVSRADFENVSIASEDQERQDELGRLLRQFVSMSCQIDSLIQENYQSKLLTQEAKLQALEMQINPHFLYNTLESVRCCAKLGMNENVCHIVDSLGNMLHFIMSKDDNKIRLRQELGLIDDYLAIQSIRFDGKISFHAQIGENCCDAVVPKLTLLPLIENAVIHGVENSMDVCQILFSVFRKGDFVCAQVKNSGTRFPPDLLNRLRNKEIIPTRNGIGLLNVDNCLRLFFKQEYELSFYNEASYAVAEVIFPYWTNRKKENNTYAEIDNC